MPGGSLARRGVRFFFLLDEPGDRHDLVAVFDDDEPHALSRPANGADVVGLHPQDHPLLRNQQELVACLTGRHADDLAVAVARGDVYDADPSARLDAILLDLGALPVAVFRDGEERSDRAYDFHGDDVVAVPESDAAHAVRRP